jgi:hypothetical protein
VGVSAHIRNVCSEILAHVDESVANGIGVEERYAVSVGVHVDRVGLTAAALTVGDDEAVVVVQQTVVGYVDGTAASLL